MLQLVSWPSVSFPSTSKIFKYDIVFDLFLGDWGGAALGGQVHLYFLKSQHAFCKLL
jgi:hypothetical protein